MFVLLPDPLRDPRPDYSSPSFPRGGVGPHPSQGRPGSSLRPTRQPIQETPSEPVQLSKDKEVDILFPLLS